MAELSIKEIKKRFKAAETHKEHWRAEYSDAYEFALPMRNLYDGYYDCLLYTSPSPRDLSTSRMPSSA